MAYVWELYLPFAVLATVADALTIRYYAIPSLDLYNNPNGYRKHFLAKYFLERFGLTRGLSLYGASLIPVLYFSMTLSLTAISWVCYYWFPDSFYSVQTNGPIYVLTVPGLIWAYTASANWRAGRELRYITGANNF